MKNSILNAVGKMRYLALLVVLILTCGNAWGAVPTGWTQVTSLSGMTVGDKIIIVTNDASKYLNGSTSKGHFSTTGLDASHPASASAAGVIQLESTGTTNKYKLKLVSTSKYITATAAKSGSGKNDAASDDYGWMFTCPSSGDFDAQYQETGKQACLRSYNNSDFRTYASTSSGATFKIYKYYVAPATTVTASPTSITFDNNTLSGGEASGSKTVTISVSNGNKSSGNYLNIWPETDEDYCEFYVNNGEEIYSSGNSTSVSNLSVEYYAIEAGTFTGNLIAQGYNSSYVAVNCTIPLSVTVAAPACANSVTIATGSPTNCTISASAASVSTCSGTRQVTISVTPSSCYAAPVDASIISKSGTTATLVSGPTLNSGHYDYVYSFAENATGTATFNASLSTKTTYTVSYAAGSVPSGGGSITGSHDNDTKTCGTNMTLPGETFHTTGYTQTGWSKTNGGSQYAAVDGSYTDNAAQTFYPVWTANKYTVTWSVNGSTYTTTANVSYNTTTSTPANPSVPGECTGSTFMGWTSNSSWASDSAPGDLFNGTSPTITGDITFYAVFADEE